MKYFNAMLFFFLCARAAVAGIIVPAEAGRWAGPDEFAGAALRWAIPGFEYAYVLDNETALSAPAGLLATPHIRLRGRVGDAPAALFMMDDPVITAGPGRIRVDVVPEQGTTAELQSLHIGEGRDTLSDLDFILEGKLRIDWSGAADVSRNENGSRIKLSQIPEPASILLVILVSVSGLFLRRTFR